MRLTHDQAASLMAALRMVMAMGGDDAGAHSALAKLEQLTQVPSSVEVDVEAGSSRTRATISSALERHRTVQLVYRPGGRADRRTAVIEPARLRIDGGYAYLDAWSRERDDWRTFRLDRVESAEELAETFAPRPLPEHLDTWFVDAPASLTITVTEAGRWCADYHPTNTVERTDGGWRITFPLVSTEWGARLLLRLGEAVLDVKETAVVEAARELAARALTHYRGAS